MIDGPAARVAITFVLCVAFLTAAPQAQSAQPFSRSSDPASSQRTSEELYQVACATCHGQDGKGSPVSTVGFAVPLPDFSDCAFATAEPDADGHAVVHEGGPIRGLDRHMPAFGDALSRKDIAMAVGHLRTFCTNASWPRGDLNLPRAFFTEKAFPENEALWTMTFTRRPEKSLGNELIYERRLGARSQVELNAPITFQQDTKGTWNRGLGDVALAFKRTVYASMRTGRIAAAGAEVVLPTGKESLGLGNGDTVFEPFVAWGQLLPRNSFLQMHGGAELPADPDRRPMEPYLRTAVGTTFAQNCGFGRAWSPQVEILWARPKGEASEWDIVPQVQVTLSKLQHVMLAAGARVPLTQRDERPTQGLVYLLWDWFDGGFFEFWR
jgi:mono/diheme cytochrome c family protein